MHTVQQIIGLCFLAFGIYVIATFVFQLKKATGSTWERLITAAEGSVSILWAKFVQLLAVIVGSIGDLGDAFGDPNIRDYANTALGNPKLVAGILLAISLVAIKARKRTL